MQHGTDKRAETRQDGQNRPGDDARNPSSIGLGHGIPRDIARPTTLRRRVYEVVEVGRGEDRLSRIFDGVIITLILLNVIAFAAETVPSLGSRYATWFTAFEIFTVAVFTIEYGLRLWSAVELPFLARLPSWRARLRFARRPDLIIDLLAILPFYLGQLLAIDLRILRTLRLLRLLKLSRYSPAMHALLRAIHNERKQLMGAGLLLGAMLLFASTGIYYLEQDAQPDKFGSVPAAAWWAMATLTTVGYGDVAPVTAGGQFFGGLVMLCGLCILALPVAIISAGFAQEVGRREFVVTWSLMSRIPLFAELDSNAVARLMPYLHAHSYPPNWQVIDAGKPADSMFFIAAGQLSATTPKGEEYLGPGDFFGETAMLEGGKYRYTRVTLNRTRVLRLYREDFKRLSATHPEISEYIERVAADRRAERDNDA